MIGSRVLVVSALLLIAGINVQCHSSTSSMAAQAVSSPLVNDVNVISLMNTEEQRWFQTYMLNYHNKIRVNAGLPALQWSNELAFSAMKNSIETSMSNFDDMDKTLSVQISSKVGNFDRVSESMWISHKTMNTVSDSFSMPNNMYSMPNNMYPMPNNMYPMPNNMYPMPNNMYPMPNNMYPMPNNMYPMPNNMYPMPNNMYPMPNNMYPMPNNMYPMPYGYNSVDKFSFESSQNVQEIAKNTISKWYDAGSCYLYAKKDVICPDRKLSPSFCRDFSKNVNTENFTQMMSVFSTHIGCALYTSKKMMEGSNVVSKNVVLCRYGSWNASHNFDMSVPFDEVVRQRLNIPVCDNDELSMNEFVFSNSILNNDVVHQITRDIPKLNNDEWVKVIVGVNDSPLSDSISYVNGPFIDNNSESSVFVSPMNENVVPLSKYPFNFSMNVGSMQSAIPNESVWDLINRNTFSNLNKMDSVSPITNVERVSSLDMYQNSRLNNAPQLFRNLDQFKMKLPERNQFNQMMGVVNTPFVDNYSNSQNQNTIWIPMSQSEMIDSNRFPLQNLRKMTVV